jgi:L1 cell adhesion molecule like protein
MNLFKIIFYFNKRGFYLFNKMFDFNDDIPTGIDLGTTNSCIGIWDGYEVKIIPNRIGEKTTPSVIYLHDGKFIIGEHIQKDLNLLNNSEKIYSLKRIIGQDYNDDGIEQEIKNLHYNIIRDKESNKPLIKLIIQGQEKYFTPEELCSLVLKKLIDDAEKYVSGKIRKVVISVPAYFDDAQRSATIEAAKLAKLEVIRIINEPTAAALSYGLGQKFCPVLKKNSCFSDIFKKKQRYQN